MNYGGLAGLRLLIVEDDGMVRGVIVRAARKCEIHVDAANDGNRAMDLIGQRDYDVVITDLKMPGVSGLELVDCLRATRPKTALIVITGFAQPDVEKRVASAGALLLHKPFNMESLVEALRWAKQRLAQPVEPA